MGILTTDKALALFELIHQPWEQAFVVAPPTKESIQYINAELEIQLPPSMIAFANRCSSYGAWFAGLGDDYNNHLHILNINQEFRDSSDPTDGFIPNWLVIINHGHDGDCDCLDTRSYNQTTGEYPIVYWSYETGTTFEIGKPDHDFSEFLENMLLRELEHLKRSQRRKAEEILFEDK